jgi:hypothetical protein
MDMSAAISQGDTVRLGTRIGTVTYVAAGFADVDFGRGDWSVVAVCKLELLGAIRCMSRVMTLG